MLTLQEAYNLHQTGRFAEAEAGYRAWLVERPDDADAMHLLGMLLHQQGDNPEALRLLTRAQELQPDNGNLEVSVATLLRTAGNPGAARLAYARALALDPNLGGAHIGIGQLALDGGDTSTAEEHFRTALRAGEDGHALAGLGAIMLARGRSEVALAYLTRAAELVPDYSMIQFMLGQVFSQRGVFAFAETALENALRLQPDLHAARAWLAEVLLKQNRPQDALVHYRALRLIPGFVVIAHVGFADIARMEQRDEQAIAYYRRALAIEPKLSTPTRMLAWMLATLGRNDEAIAAYDAYLKHAPEDVEMRILRDDVHKLHTGNSA